MKPLRNHGLSTTIIILVVAVIVVGVILISNSTDSNSQSGDMPATTTEETTTDTTEATQPTETAADTADNADTESSVTVVRYTANGFTPETVTVSAGETVRFQNQTGAAMWVASDMHPTHADYDGTTRSEHCQSGAASFDQCASGATYSFTFDQTGSFDYHNHLQPNDGGTITVQ